MSESIIKVQGLGKKYVISHEGTERYTALRDVISRGAKNLLRKRQSINHSKEDFWALKDLSFEIKKGEAVGIIGRNGAGKSTLLKLLSRITEPTTGTIEINGRVASLLEVGTGFHPELTGRENIFLNGSILGMTRLEIKRKFEEIVAFSGVEKFLDTPVKRYSSGMYVRLAFAVAAHLEPEILVVDEVLAVGDAEFQKKCLGKMGEVSQKEGRTVLFVSHNLGAVSQLCKKGLLLQEGHLIFNGSSSDAISKYLDMSSDTSSYSVQRESELYIRNIQLFDEDKIAKNEFRHNENILIQIDVHHANKGGDCRLIVLVQNSHQQKIFAAETFLTKNSFSLRINKNFLVRGNYSLHCILYTPAVTQYDKIDECCNFRVIDGGSDFSHLEGLTTDKYLEITRGCDVVYVITSIFPCDELNK